MDALEFLTLALRYGFSQTVPYLPFAFFLVCLFIFWEFWVNYVQQLFISKTPMILLELRLPKEVFKSPRAMEIALTSLHQSSPGANFWALYYEGKLRAYTSLEIVSIGGKIHFYIYLRKGLRALFETQLYAQYPDIEIHEVPDYATEIPYGAPGAEYEMWGCEYKLAGKTDALPLKTYIDFGLDRDPKEEFKIDPISQVLEFMGSLTEGENMWFQMLIMAHAPQPPRRGAKNAKKFEVRAKELVDDLSKRKLAAEKAKEGKTITPIESKLTKAEEEVLEAVERKASKPAFDVGMRTIYVARKDKFNGGHIPGITGLLRPFGANNLNSFKPSNVATPFDYPWQDPLGVRARKIKRELFEWYVKRGWFYEPYVQDPFVLSSEEIATIYHIPGATAKTPTLGRLESKRGEAPVNLPI